MCVCVCVQCTLSWWLNLRYVQLVYIKWVLRISHIIYSTRDPCTIHNAAVIVKYNKRRVFTAQPGAFRIYYCYYNLFLFFSSSTRRWLGEPEALCACTVQCAYCIFFSTDNRVLRTPRVPLTRALRNENNERMEIKHNRRKHWQLFFCIVGYDGCVFLFFHLKPILCELT